MEAIVYTWARCRFCTRAKELLTEHGIAFREEVLDGDRARLARIQGTFGAKTMPLVLLDGERIAGLEALEAHLKDGLR